VFTVENTEELPASVRIFNGPESSRLTVLNFTVEEVAKKLEWLRGDKSGGPDDLKPRLLLNLYDEISQPLCFIFNKSMDGMYGTRGLQKNLCFSYLQEVFQELGRKL